MADNIEKIKQKYVVSTNKDLVYLAAIGEKKQIEKQALIYLVDHLFQYYYNKQMPNELRIQMMEEVIAYMQAQAKLYDFQLPDYLQSAKAFNEFMDRLNGDKRTEEKQAVSNN